MGAYLLWGSMPIIFNAAKPAEALEILAHRIVWSLVFCFILLALARGYKRLFAIFRSPTTFWVLAAASIVLALNWFFFVLGVQTGRVIEVSLGYYINPLLSVLLGVIFLGEKLRPLQWAAMGVGLVAVLVISFGYGQVPWLGLGVALSFGIYGLLKNKVGPRAGALEAMTVETTVLTPLAVGYIIFLMAAGQSHFGTQGTGHLLVMLALGPVTAIPLILFGSAAKRVPLSWIGMMQYITPSMQFLTGWLLYNEHMDTSRWIGFIIIWITVIMVVADGVLASRRHRKLRKR